MSLSKRARTLVSDLNGESVKFGDLKKLAKEIKRDHDLALELWASGHYHPRLLATLIFDKNLLTAGTLEELASDIRAHEEDERTHLADWLLANQLMKSRKLVSLIETWREHSSSILRRLFWYHQARLRWTGQTPPPNSEDLLEALERDLAKDEPDVQWAMNFCAGQIGVFEPKLRSRCIRLGKKLGLYKDDVVAKNCTPSYLPEFIRIEAAKRE